MAARRRISKIGWDSIVRGIRTGMTVPFLGAGVNASGNGYEGLPVGGAVARSLMEKLIERKVGDFADLIEVRPKPALRRYPDLGRARVEDLARVALHLELEGGYRAVVDYLKEIIADEERQPPELLRVLARLPFGLIVTTNYDRLLERAFDAEGEPAPLVLSQPVDGFTPEAFEEWQRKLAGDQRLIYKLHGSFDDPSPKLVISEDDYIEFLGLASDPKLGVPTQIRARIADSVLLFLGYGLEDWDVRSIYKLLIEEKKPRERNRSFAVQKDPSRFWVNFWERKDVVIYNIDLHDFAGQLEQEYQKRL
jgi:SIR2-like protein